MPELHTHADPLLGTMLGDFKIVEKLGQGGFGNVYKAWNTKLNRIVALKMLSESIKAKDASAAERFLHEARLAAQLEHPNIVATHFVGEAGGHHFIEMRYVEGQTLRQVLDRGPLDARAATTVILEAAKGLAAAHERGIVHCDVKPHNIMIDKNKHVLVSDFGLAQFGRTFEGVTADGKLLGTPFYISPEQFRREQVDARSDIYSLGATYFHAVTGEPPFNAPTIMEIVQKHLNEPVRQPNIVNPNVPFEVSGIIVKAMAKDPSQRYQSCEEMINDLQAVLYPPAVGQPQKAPKSKAAWYAGLAAAAVLIALVAGFFVIQSQKKPLVPPAQTAAAAQPARTAQAVSATGQAAPAPAPLPAAPAASAPLPAAPAPTAPTTPSAPTATPVAAKPAEPVQPGTAAKTATATPAAVIEEEAKPTTSVASGKFPNNLQREAVGLFLAQRRKGIQVPRTITIREDGQGNYKTISEAIASAKQGDVVEIADNGLYKEEIKILASCSNLWLRAAKGQMPVVDAEGERERCVTIDPSASGVILEGITFTGAKKVAMYAEKVDDLTVANCAFQKNLRCIEVRESSSAFILANVFRENNGACVSTYKVKNVVASDNAFLDMPYVSGLDRKCIRAEYCDSVYALNNLCVRVNYSLIFLRCHFVATHNLFHAAGNSALQFGVSDEGNVFRDNMTIKGGTAIWPEAWTKLTGQEIDHNVYNENNTVGTVNKTDAPTVYHKTLEEWQAATGYDKHSIAEDPCFINAADDDYRIYRANPCAGKASDGRDPGILFEVSGLELPLWDGKPLARKPTKEELLAEKRRAEAQALVAELKPVNDLIDQFKYDEAAEQAKALEDKHGKLVTQKLANIEALKACQAAAIQVINAGQKKFSLKDFSRRYAYAGDIQKADDRFIYAMDGKFKKTWKDFGKEETLRLYRALGDSLGEELRAVPGRDASARLHMALAVLLVEGNVDSKGAEAARKELAAAKEKGADIAPYTQYLDDLVSLDKAAAPETPTQTAMLPTGKEKKEAASATPTAPGASAQPAAPTAAAKPAEPSTKAEAGTGNAIIVRKDGKGDYKTIEEALIAAKDGDAIWIADGGVYAEPLLPVRTKRNILLSGNPEKPTILTIDHQKLSTDEKYVYGLKVGSGWTIQFVQFRWDLKSPGASAVSFEGPGKLLIQNCSFSGFANNIDLKGEDGDITIRNCAFFRCSDALVMWECGDRSAIRFLHNTIARNGGVIHKYGKNGKFSCISQGNIFFNVPRAYHDDRYETPTGTTEGEGMVWISDRNCFFDTPSIYTREPLPRVEAKGLREWFAMTKNDKNSLTKDPLLVDPEKGDFRLRPNSPCVGRMQEEDGKRTSIGINFQAMRHEAEEQSKILKAVLRDRKKE